jgi:alkanesulfonate monooxygenase SsuD/methylene tetrahydromethanopterin reductase-like flavin-dependent oxidoreductase (luciferase family)
MMTWCYVGETDDEYRRRVREARTRPGQPAPNLDDELARIEQDCIVGTPDRAAERLSEYAAVGVQRIMLNHELYTDLGMLECLATQVFPKVVG